MRMFVTGGTGFIGRWLLESFAWANRRLSLGAELTALTRDPAAFSSRAPHLAEDPSIHLHHGDVRSFIWPEGSFSHVIHGATDVSSVDASRGSSLLENIIAGTRRVLDFTVAAKSKKLLFLSSGAVYGQQPADVPKMSEDYAGAPRVGEARYEYAEGKRRSERLCTAHAQQGFAEAKLARCFSFVGPLLPLDGNFAVGNFIRNALRREPILVQGDGTSVRTYLYAADLATWLWTILFRGESGRPYNVGGSIPWSIIDLAHLVTRTLAPDLAVHVAGKASLRAPARYVPCTQRASTELRLTESISLEDGIRRTAQWCCRH